MQMWVSRYLKGQKVFFGADLDLVVGYDRVEPIKMAAGPLAQHFFCTQHHYHHLNHKG